MSSVLSNLVEVSESEKGLQLTFKREAARQVMGFVLELCTPPDHLLLNEDDQEVLTESNKSLITV